MKNIRFHLGFISLAILVTCLYLFAPIMSFIEPLLFLKAELTGAYSNYLIFSSFEDTYYKGNEWWRLITPIFIHFSITHLVFNCLWIFVLGQQIELKDGKIVFVLLMIISAVIGNYAQFLDQGAHLFGGLSGCVYGLFGYAMTIEFQEQKIRYGLPPSIYIFMLAWLVMGFAGVLRLFGFGEIANFAHLGGLASGVFFGMLLIMFNKITFLR